MVCKSKTSGNVKDKGTLTEADDGINNTEAMDAEQERHTLFLLYIVPLLHHMQLFSKSCAQAVTRHPHVP